MTNFLKSPEGAIALVALAVVALIALASRGGRRRASAKGGDSAPFPYGADTGPACDCGGDGGGGD